MEAIQNVVGLDLKTVSQDIEAYFGDIQSPNTKRSYLRNIKDFFTYMKHKDISQLTREDLIFTKSDIKRYRNHLKLHAKNATVNQKINSIRGMFRELAADYPEINLLSFKLKSLDQSDSEIIGFFDDYAEAMLMVDKAKELPNGEMKNLILDVAVHTSFRLNAVLRMRPRDFKVENGIAVAKTVDKGSKKVEKGISDRLLNAVMEYVEKNEIKQNDQLFNITDRQITVDIQTLCSKMGISKDRNISFHSIRKVGSDYELSVNRDLKAAQNSMGHKSPIPTLNHYAKLNQSLDQSTGIQMESKEDLSKLQSMNQEQLIKIISMSSRATQKELNQNANKLDIIL